MGTAVAELDWKLSNALDGLFEVSDQSGAVFARFTDDRDRAMATDGLALLGLDYPLVTEQLAKWRTTLPERLGACVRPEGSERAVVCWWFVEAATPQGERKAQVLALAATKAGRRAMTLERLAERLLDLPPGGGFLDVRTRHRFMAEVVEPILHRELDHRGLLTAGGSIAAELLAWLEVGR